MDIKTIAKQAKKAALQLQSVTSKQKDVALIAMADALLANQQTIISANKKDLENAEKNKLSQALVDRLQLDAQRIESMADGLKQVAELTDPVGEVLDEFTRPNGLIIKKVRVPIGVITIIYESRPNVTADVAGLCLKASNAAILRGGREALQSNLAIANCLYQAIKDSGLPEHSIQLIETTEHSDVTQLVQLPEYIDLVIPRGGERLIKAVMKNSYVPIIKHDKGLCHTYVDAAANINMALDICENAKCQRPGVCNAMETLLVHEKIALNFLPALAERMHANNVELRGDEKTREIIDTQAATDQDWDTEYLDLILSIKIVNDEKEAVAHINRHGSHHSDAIISDNELAQQYFLQNVDSATAYINASTRFTDGGEFGMGAEIGISTDKLHARGPMGLKELTTYKYLIQGSGQIR